VGIGDGDPVALADPEGGGTSGGARGALDVSDLDGVDAQVAAVGLIGSLVFAQFFLLDHRDRLEDLQRGDVTGL
jgi:hypothetical protein